MDVLYWIYNVVIGSLWFIFFFSAVDNIPKADEIRTLVKDTWDTRIAKLRLSADSFVRQQEAHARVREICDNLMGLYEVVRVLSGTARFCEWAESNYK